MMKKFLTLLVTLSLLLSAISIPAIMAAEGDTAEQSETASEDVNPGTLTYTPSKDGKEMTISYEIAGETVSYTVPNNLNYISGGYTGVDDLGRSLYNSDEVGAYGSGGERYIGLFYFLWHGEHGDSGIFDLQKIIDECGVEAAGSTNCGKYGPVGAMHFFAEPLYGYYYANDAWVMRKHVELLTNANIDFLYFDVTNSYTYLHNALQLMEILHEFNEQGYDAPQIVFYTNSGSYSVVRSVYDNIYAKNLYPDTWFCMNNKPIIIAPADANIDDFFHVKQNIWPNEGKKPNTWPWMDFTWPPSIIRTAKEYEGIDGSAISVSIAQHCGTICFSDSSLYGNFNNRGRSFTSETRAGPKFLKECYEAWQADNSLTLRGLNFQSQFDNAIESNAMYILVTGWNEWVAQRQETGSDRICFIDTASMEFSRDAEMMRGGYFDNYYMQLIYNVQRAKGAAPIVVQDARKPIDVTAGFDQWNDVIVEYKDPTGDTVDRDATGFGHKNLTNTTGRNDIVTSKVISDTKNVYFYTRTDENITKRDATGSWMQLYINSDADASTGWYGYDFIINYNTKDDSTTTVARYTGEDNTFSFEIVGNVPYRVEGKEMMIAVPQEMLGIENYYEIDLEFKWADSTITYDEMEDFYCDGDVAPLGRLNYVYQNYIEGKSVPPVTETETETIPETVAPDTVPETVVASETVAETVGETRVETTIDPADEGCASVVITTSGAIVLSLTAAAFVLRKKDECFPLDD